MKRNKKDILHQEKQKLKRYVQMADDAIQIVTSTISNLEAINSGIMQRTQEIEEYQRELTETKTGLENARQRNERVIKNFNALLGVKEGE